MDEREGWGFRRTRVYQCSSNATSTKIRDVSQHPERCAVIIIIIVVVVVIIVIVIRSVVRILFEEEHTCASGSGDELTWFVPSHPERFLQGGLN